MNSKTLAVTLASGLLVLTVVLIWLLTGPPDVARAADLTVCPAGPPTCQYAVIQDAVDDAEEGDVIKIATGTYTEVNDHGGLDQVVYISKTITIRGGYTTAFTDPPDPEANPTTLDAEAGGRVMFVTEDIDAAVQGLRLIGGATDGDGGGVMIEGGATLAVSDTLITSNTAASQGGGIAVIDGSWALITGTQVYANSAAGSGGGIGAEDGGNLRLARTWVVANSAYFNDGGGIAVGNGGSAYIENSIIAGNDMAASGNAGGGLYFGEGGPFCIVNSHVVGNQASGKGAAMATYSPVQVGVTNTLIIRNTGTTGIDDKNGTSAVFTLNYCDTYGNSPDGTVGVTINRTNCLGAPPEDGLDPLLMGGTLPGGVGPAFAAQWMSYDYRLQATSPAINAGTPIGAPSADIEGTPRDATPDIGAYERPCPPLVPTLVSPPDESQTCDTTPTFQWSAVNGATSYRIQVDDDPDFSSRLINTTTTEPTYTRNAPLSPGTYYWRVKALSACGDSTWSASWPFTIGSTPLPPSHIAPPDGGNICDTTPTFEWLEMSGAASYRFQADDDQDFSSPLIDTTTAEPNFTPAAALPLDTYYWRVKAQSPCGNSTWSTGWQFTIVSSLPAPTLSSPPDGGSTCDTTPTFEWSPVSGSYQVQVDDNSDFSSPVINTTVSDAHYTPGAALSPGTYYWRVKALSACGNSTWSLKWQFSIPAVPTVPTLVSPPDESQTCDTTPTLEWSAVSGATSYRIVVDGDADFSSPVINTTTTDLTYTPVSPLTPGTYYWRVKALSACGNSAWSTSWQITTGTTPTTPSAVSPPDGGSTCDTMPTFQWLGMSGAATYRFQADDDQDFSSPLIDTATVDPSFTPATGLSLGTYYWRLKALSPCGNSTWSTGWQLTIVSTLPPPTLSSPPDGGSTCDTTPTFEWSPVSGSYRIQLDEDQDFSSPLIDTTTADHSFTPGAALSLGTCYWRVKSRSPCGNSAWSPQARLSILSEPSKPTLLSPADRVSLCQTTPTFEWSPVTWATSYRIQVDTETSFSSPDFDITTEDCDCTPDVSPPMGTCYWRVQAVNACGESKWSSAQRFKHWNCGYLPLILRGY